MSADFLDSNVLLYLFDESQPAKRSIARDLVTSGIQERSVISYQVVQETLNVMTRLPAPPTAEGMREFLDAVLIPLWRVVPTRALYQRAIDLRERYQYSFYDSLIVAAALESGCTRLLSEDLQHGQRIESLTITNPFAAA